MAALANVSRPFEWSNGQHGVPAEDKSEPEPMSTTRAEVDILAQVARQSAGVFHMMDEAKTAGTESALPAGAGGAAAVADAAERTPTIPADEMARMGDEIVGALKTVYDPEIPADLYELGLI